MKLLKFLVKIFIEISLEGRRLIFHSNKLRIQLELNIIVLAAAAAVILPPKSIGKVADG
jgi:hypothetical protein